MKCTSFLFLIYSLSIFSLDVKPKLCINCKYFVKDIFTKNEFGKCSQFIRYDDTKNHLVTGIDDRKKDLHYCTVARSYDSMCGEDGKMYKPKKEK